MTFEEAKVRWKHVHTLLAFNDINIELFNLSILQENEALRDSGINDDDDQIKNHVLYHTWNVKPTLEPT